MRRNFAAVLFLAFYAGYLPLSRYVLEMAPHRYYDLTFAIVDEGRVAIDTFQSNTIDTAYFKGHF